MAIALAARITGNRNRLDVSAAAAITVLSSDPTSAIMAAVSRSGLALIAIGKSDLDSANEQYSSLLPHAGTILTAALTSVDRILGLLSAAIGNSDQATVHFEDALAFCRKAGYRPELAWTCCDYSDTLLARNGEEGRAKARSLLDESLAISTDLGMRPLMERVAARRNLVQVEPAQAPAFPDGLTQREVEVIRLVALGKTDREIAEDLFISFRTVGNHVRNILNKTGAANRTKAAAYAALNGLTGDASDAE
jgi:DNA-binding CsgD family transcriptional regulator